MTTRNTYVSPGTPGFGDIVIRGQRVPPTRYFPKAVLKAGHAQVFRPASQGIRLQTIIIGANVVAGHANAFSALVGPFIWGIQNITGQWAQAVSRHLVPVDTGATRDSIFYSLETAPNRISVSIGPTTFYAPFIEYGLGGHFHIGPRPFMSDTLHFILPFWQLVFQELALIAKQGAKTSAFRTQPYAKELNPELRRWRKHLYSIEKEIGDIIPFGLPTPVQKARGGLIGLARVLGDLQAVMGATVAARFTRRIQGQVTGRLIGVGSHTVFGYFNYSASIPGATRIYNRIAGKYATRFVSQSKFFRGI